MKGFSFVPSQQTTRAVVAAPRRLRFLLVALIFAGWALLIVVRLVWLQVATHSQYVDLAVRQQQRTFEVAPRRGVLYDRNLHELAMTVLVDSVYGVPTEIQDKDANRGGTGPRGSRGSDRWLHHCAPDRRALPRLHGTSPGSRASSIRRPLRG